jgi:hypothetical protein
MNVKYLKNQIIIKILFNLNNIYHNEIPKLLSIIKSKYVNSKKSDINNEI